MAAINLKSSESLECTPMTSRLVQAEFEKQMDWTPGQGIEEDNEDSKEEEESKKEAKSLIATYNEAMDNLSVQTKIGNVSPLTFQLKSSWDEATEDEKEVCLKKVFKAGNQLNAGVLSQSASSNHALMITKSALMIKGELWSQTRHISKERQYIPVLNFAISVVIFKK